MDSHLHKMPHVEMVKAAHTDEDDKVEDARKPPSFKKNVRHLKLTSLEMIWTLRMLCIHTAYRSIAPPNL